MNFSYINHELHCERVPVAAIAREVGTPFYVYSLDEIERRARAFLTAFPDALIAYAYKANANLAILRHLVSLGIGADVVSGGELWRALKVGTPSNKIVMNGNGKTANEIAYAIDSDVLCINVDSAEDLELVAETARMKNKFARIAIRVNPDIDAQTHPYISTGLKKSKFGVPTEQAIQLYHTAREYKELEIIGVHCHIGSQITQVGPLLAVAKAMSEIVARIKRDGFQLKLINLGGGLGIVYRDENPLTPREWADMINLTGLKDLSGLLVLEPGRNIVGTAGALVASVVHLKRTETKNFLVLDTGMNALMRPSLYDAYHEIVSVREDRGGVTPPLQMEVVGPICESADVLGKERELPALKRGDLIAVLNAGAYGFSMASRYNQQPLPAEVVVQGDAWRVATQRETWEQMAEREVG